MCHPTCQSKTKCTHLKWSHLVHIVIINDIEAVDSWGFSVVKDIHLFYLYLSKSSPYHRKLHSDFTHFEPAVLFLFIFLFASFLPHLYSDTFRSIPLFSRENPSLHTHTLSVQLGVPTRPKQVNATFYFSLTQCVWLHLYFKYQLERCS